MKKNELHIALILLVICCAVLSGCGNQDDVDDEDSIKSDDDDDNDDTTIDDDDDNDDVVTPASIVENYSYMGSVVAASMDEPDYFHDCTWHLHFGDALMYGPSFDLAEDVLTGDEFHSNRGIDALNTNLYMVEAATGSLLGLIEAFGDPESLSMALLGLLESGQYIQVPRYAESSADLVRLIDRITALFDDYLPPQLGEFAGMTYGPTAISSLLALLQLGMVISGPEEEIDEHLARAHEVLEHIHQKAWSNELGAYRFAPDDDRLMLYPNVTMMLSYGRALLFTGNDLYEERIEDIYQGIQPLRAKSGDHYYSPYSREEANAVDEDYATLSSQNYTMIGLWLAYFATGDQHYLDDIDLILGWIETHLFVDKVLKHHWVNGRVANEEDEYDFCSGCNLQTLYILKMIELEVVATKKVRG